MSRSGCRTRRSVECRQAAAHDQSRWFLDFTFGRSFFSVFDHPLRCVVGCETMIGGRRLFVGHVSEACMAKKDKGGRAAKKVGKSLKEKRQDKKAKRAASDGKRDRVT